MLADFVSERREIDDKKGSVQEEPANVQALSEMEQEESNSHESHQVCIFHN